MVKASGLLESVGESERWQRFVVDFVVVIDGFGFCGYCESSLRCAALSIKRYSNSNCRISLSTPLNEKRSRFCRRIWFLVLNSLY
jgi:hypothetical protein